MKVTLNFAEDFDVYHLFVLLGNAKAKAEDELYRHQEMVSLLTGNTNTEKAKNHLSFSQDRVNECLDKIKRLDYLREQLAPIVDKVIEKNGR